ncbi:MAG: putative DNA binding domain-containing protein [Candidatus Kerfeldbacteria bacterium]|nr:putative DNA binding domain-containing protein [Candidatus Kerfeldbacteria bacterium]
MEQQEFEKLISDLVALPAETECVEFKVNNCDPREIGNRISALSNAANLYDKKMAYLIFGIENETHNIVGTKYTPSAIKENGQILQFWLIQRLDPKIDYRIHEIEIEGKRLALFVIPPALSKPTQFDGTSYIRIGSATPKLSAYPEKESKIWANINRKSFERGVAKEHCSVSEVLELLDYAKYLELTKQELPSQTNEIVAKLAGHGIVRKVFDDNYDITNLGAILFAKDLTMFPSVRRKAVRVVVYNGNTRQEIKKERTGKLGYAIGFETLTDFINDQLPSNEEISRALRKEVKMYPEVAIREFVANALIHQDCSITGAGPLVEIFADRIVITNTGSPLIEVDRFIDYPPRSRNEDLAAFMRQIGVCEELGTGVDRALGEIALYQLPAPKFEKFEDSTRITLYDRRPLKDMTIEDRVRACFQHCALRYVENGRMTNASLRERLGISESNYPAATAIINETIKRGLVKTSDKPKEYVPFWA